MDWILLSLGSLKALAFCAAPEEHADQVAAQDQFRVPAHQFSGGHAGNPAVQLSGPWARLTVA